jgi:hypothetical protein
MPPVQWVQFSLSLSPDSPIFFSFSTLGFNRRQQRQLHRLTDQPVHKFEHTEHLPKLKKEKATEQQTIPPTPLSLTD